MHSAYLVTKPGSLESGGLWHDDHRNAHCPGDGQGSGLRRPGHFLNGFDKLGVAAASSLWRHACCSPSISARSQRGAGVCAIRCIACTLRAWPVVHQGCAVVRHSCKSRGERCGGYSLPAGWPRVRCLDVDWRTSEISSLNAERRAPVIRHRRRPRLSEIDVKLPGP